MTVEMWMCTTCYVCAMCTSDSEYECLASGCVLPYTLNFLVCGHSECSSVTFDRSFVYKQQTSVKTAEMKTTQ